MKRQWLIDAYNVMHQLPDVEPVMNRDISEARRLMAIKTDQLCARRNRRAHLVFDGAPGMMPIRQEHVTIDYSYPETADTFITRQVSVKGQGHKWIVVTDDRQLRRNTRLHGAELMTTRQFCSLMTVEKSHKMQHIPGKVHPDKKANVEVPDDEVQEMLRLFKKNGGDASGS